MKTRRSVLLAMLITLSAVIPSQPAGAVILGSLLDNVSLTIPC